MTGILEGEMFDTRRPFAISDTGDKTRIQASTIEDNLSFADNRYSLLEDDAFIIRTLLYAQRVAHATIIYAQADGRLRVLPGLAVIAVLSVCTHIPRSSRRMKRRCYEEYYESDSFHLSLRSSRV